MERLIPLGRTSAQRRDTLHSVVVGEMKRGPGFSPRPPSGRPDFPLFRTLRPCPDCTTFRREVQRLMDCTPPKIPFPDFRFRNVHFGYCLGCSRFRRLRRRHLCRRCYYRTEVRNRIIGPPQPKQEPMAFEPTQWPVGSRERLDVMSARVAHRLPAKHPLDAQDSIIRITGDARDY